MNPVYEFVIGVETGLCAQYLGPSTTHSRHDLVSVSLVLITTIICGCVMSMVYVDALRVNTLFSVSAESLGCECEESPVNQDTRQPSVCLADMSVSHPASSAGLVNMLIFPWLGVNGANGAQA